jgi:hypothetical protein
VDRLRPVHRSRPRSRTPPRRGARGEVATFFERCSPTGKNNSSRKHPNQTTLDLASRSHRVPRHRDQSQRDQVRTTAVPRTGASTARSAPSGRAARLEQCAPTAP